MSEIDHKSMKIIIELHENYKHWPKGRITKLNKWLQDLTTLLVDGSFMNYTKTFTIEHERDTTPLTDQS